MTDAGGLFFRVFGVVRGYSFGAVARPVATARSREFWPEIFEMAFGVMNIFSPNKIGAHNAGWPSQFRFAVTGFWSGVCDLCRSANDTR